MLMYCQQEGEKSMELNIIKGKDEFLNGMATRVKEAKMSFLQAEKNVKKQL